MIDFDANAMNALSALGMVDVTLDLLDAWHNFDDMPFDALAAERDIRKAELREAMNAFEGAWRASIRASNA